MAENAVFSTMEKAAFRLIMSFTDTDVNGPREAGWHELPGPARNWDPVFDWVGSGSVSSIEQTIARRSLGMFANIQP
jgi:hypothetical protein